MTDALLTLRRSLERGGALLMSDQHRVRLERWVRGGLEARRLRQADAAVVSFGKAGRTWLRVMLSHFYRARYGIDEPILFEFDNLHRLNRAIPKLFFTHDNYLGDWTGQGRSKADYFERPVLFLARHPAALGQRHIVVAVADHHRLHARLAVDARLHLAGDLQHHLFFQQIAGAQGARGQGPSHGPRGPGAPGPKAAEPRAQSPGHKGPGASGSRPGPQ